MLWELEQQNGNAQVQQISPDHAVERGYFKRKRAPCASRAKFLAVSCAIEDEQLIVTARRNGDTMGGWVSCRRFVSEKILCVKIFVAGRLDA